MRDIIINKKNIITLSIIAIVLSLICVGSSPLLDYMDPDSQNFRLIGRALAAGQVAYRDIFDHKGPYIFFINEIAAMITPNSELGLFILECIENVVNIVLVYVIARNYTENDENAVMSAIAFMAVYFNFFTFVTGNLTDSWSVLFQLISMLLICRYGASNVEEHPPVYMYIHGVCATIVLMTRPNNVCMWIPFGIVLAIRLFSLKRISNFFVNLVTLILGIVTGCIPYIFYGIRHNCFDEMWFGMFTANFTYTSNNAKLYRLPSFLKEYIFDPSFLVIILCIVSTVIVVRYLKSGYLKISFVSMFLSSLVFMNVSLITSRQYKELFVVFTIPFIIAFFNKYGKLLKVSMWVVLITILVLLGNLQLIKQITKYGGFHYFYENAQAMKQVMDVGKEDKVLVTGCNSVMYNVTDTLPHIKYFITYGGGLDYWEFPDAVHMQRDSILSLENKYVIVNRDSDGSIFDITNVDQAINDCLENYYRIIYESPNRVHMLLYELKED